MLLSGRCAHARRSCSPQTEMSELIRGKNILCKLCDYLTTRCSQAAGSLIDRAIPSRKLCSHQLMMAEPRRPIAAAAAAERGGERDELVSINNHSSLIWPADFLLLLPPPGDQDSGSSSDSSTNHNCSRLIDSLCDLITVTAVRGKKTPPAGGCQW